MIMAAGAQTHELVPGLERILNATGANIVHVKIPPELQEKSAQTYFLSSLGITPDMMKMED